MNDVERWIYFDGPEPEHLRPLFEAVRDVPPADAETKARLQRVFFTRLDAMLAGADVAPSAPAVPLPPAPVALALGGPPSTELGAPTGSGHSSFGGPTAPPRLPSEPPPPPESVRASQRFAGTLPFELAPELREKAGRLPFKAPGDPSLPKAAPRTMQVPVMRSGFGETAPVGDDSITRAIAALPFAGTTIGRGVVPFPRLTLQQYASLCAELAAARAPVDTILLKYHVVSQAGREALDEHWRSELAARPEDRAQFKTALAEFTAYLRGGHR